MARRYNVPKQTKEKFVAKANKVHDNFYSYEKTIYVGCFVEVIITCPIHGDFLQKPHSHINNRGCKECGKIKQMAAQINRAQCKTLEQFIREANLIHNNKYDYTKAIFTMITGKIEIVCPKHGSFWQKGYRHLQGRGCWECSDSVGEKLIIKILKLNNIDYERQKRFSTCRGKKYPLSFDFYLPKYNFLIEFDGQTHYEDIYGEEAFLRTQKHDKIKNEWIVENNHKLLRIPYYERPNIEKLILNFINI